MSNRQQQTTRNRAIWSDKNVNAGELEILEQVHLAAICDSKDVRNALKTPELQKLIKNIDGSKCRLEALAAAQHNVPDFKNFCDQLLSVIYCAEDARHQYR